MNHHKLRRRKKLNQTCNFMKYQYHYGSYILVLVGITFFLFVAFHNTSKATTAKILPRLRGSRVWVKNDAQRFNENNVASSAKNLVMVAGHSVIVSGDVEDAGLDESVWWLFDYQKGQGMPEAIVGHIRAGIEASHNDPESLLIFSGGQTRSATGPLSEGSSYFEVSDAMELWPKGSTVRARTVAEEYATDSFENLLFSICRFREITGRYPENITVVSFSFKQRRFETLHIPAIRWPEDNFRFVGYNPPSSTGFDVQRSSLGEQENAAKPFESDPYGCHSEILQKKRRERNPFYRTPPYSKTCPDMAALLEYCGTELINTEKVPWRSSRQ
mmetsp:Transcript_16226/g.23867  ORF Transcript_16226/g.23867 Transcript_16226/m.23867 type:complete len:330 (+) Transcript_16226:94-1083(+)